MLSKVNTWKSGTTEGADQARRTRCLLRVVTCFMVTVLVRIPIANVTLVPVGAEFQPRVTLYVQVLDKKGKTSPVSEQVMHLNRIKAEDLERVLVEGFWTYELKLLMEPGEQKIAIGVRDDLNAEVSLLTRFVDVGR